MRTTSITRPAALLGIGLLGLTACGGGGEATENGNGASDTGGAPEVSEEDLVDGGTFRHALGVEVGSIIPMSANQPQERQVISYAYETLLYTDDEGEYHPWLAESWEMGEDGDSVTFELKDGVTFHDGTVFDAAVAAANLNYHANPDNASVVQDSLPEGLSAEGEGQTLTVTAEETEVFLDVIIGSIDMVAEAGLDDPESLEEGSNGTGLYALTDIQPDKYTYERRDDYDWGPGDLTSDSTGLPDELEVSVVSDESTRTNLLLSDDLNAAPVTGPDRDRLETEGYYFAGVINPIGQMQFNEREDRPTSDPLVREALIRGFDHEEAGEVVSAGNPVEITSWITEAPFICHNEEPVWEKPDFDPELAGELLDEAGWELNGEVREQDGEELVINFIYDAGADSHASAAELVREYWLEIGVETELLPMDGAAWSEYLYETFDWDTGWVQIGVGGPTTQHMFWGGATPEEGGLNYMGTDSEAYDEAAAAAQATEDQDEACGLWDEAERVLVEDFHTFWAAGTITPTFMNGAIFEITDYVQAPSIRMTE